MEEPQGCWLSPSAPLITHGMVAAGEAAHSGSQEVMCHAVMQDPYLDPVSWINVFLSVPPDYF